ncbi:MAG: hypothetical protein Q8882_06045 [Bacillota bacterium]|nr:hypothetical protein [Bacillota bacterium]
MKKLTDVLSSILYLVLLFALFLFIYFNIGYGGTTYFVRCAFVIIAALVFVFAYKSPYSAWISAITGAAFAIFGTYESFITFNAIVLEMIISALAVLLIGISGLIIKKEPPFWLKKTISVIGCVACVGGGHLLMSSFFYLSLWSVESEKVVISGEILLCCGAFWALLVLLCMFFSRERKTEGFICASFAALAFLSELYLSNWSFPTAVYDLAIIFILAHILVIAASLFSAFKGNGINAGNFPERPEM